MLPSLRRSVALVLSLFVAAEAAYGLGIRIRHQDPTGVARGGAFTATADNPSAIYYNPAGITQLQGAQVQAGAYAITFDVQHEAVADGRDYDTISKVAAVPQLYATYRLPETRFAFGVGVYAPYGFGTDWPDETPFRTLATKNQLVYLSVNPVAAVQLTDSLSLAAGLTINYGETDLRRGLLVPGDEFKFKGDGVGYGFNLGLLWQPHRMHSFGINYRSATKIDFEGDVRIRSKTPLFLPSSTEDANAEFDFPQHVTAGYSFRPTKAWNFEVNVDWTDWNDVGLIVIEKESGDLVEVFDWRSKFTVMSGATYTMENGLALSAGYFYSPSVVPDANYTVAVPDVDLHVFSAGLDYRTERWRFGVAYNFGYGPETTVEGSALSPAGQTADGKYRFLGHGVALAVGCTF